jgi:multidrug efflux system outer membrane protein
MKKVAILSLLLVVSAACAMRRPYVAPVVEPATLPSAAPLVTNEPFDPRWWQQFADPVLDAAITRALEANLDVRIAVARVDQARGFSDEVDYARYPTVTAGASVDRRDQIVPGFSDERRGITTYRAGFDAFWELDLFGRVRSQIAAATANADSYAASLDDARVRVVAEVARNYFELRGLQQQLVVAEQSLSNQRESLRLTTVRRDGGIGEEQDVASAAARVAATEATMPALRLALVQREHRLAVLLGRRPGAHGLDLSPRAYPVLGRALAIGPAAELLKRRPDVRAAERHLASVTGIESIAAADLYPRITVTGFLGFIAGRGSLFGTSESGAWAVTPAMSWAAFDLGGARARLRGAEAATREALAEFDQTILLALEETDVALARYREEQQRLVKQMEQGRESARAADIARARYREGAVDFLTLLDAERTELQARDAVAQAEAGVYTSVVSLYKALGGIPSTPSTPPTPSISPPPSVSPPLSIPPTP